MELINFAIVRHPLNWVIVLLMVIVAGIGIHLVLDFYSITPSTRET